MSSRTVRCSRWAAWPALFSLALVGCSEGESATGLAPGATALSVAYPTPSGALLVGVAIAPLVPTVSGAVTGFSIDPALPAGLVLDPLLGTVAGAPLAPIAPTAFTVTASGPGGSSTSELTLEVSASFTAPRAALALSFDPPRLAHWRVDAADGALVPGTSLAVAPQPFRAALHPASEFLYVAHLAGTLSTYRLDRDTGEPTATGALNLGPDLVDVEVHPSGRFLYAASLGTGRLLVFAIDPATGALTPVGAPFPAPGVTDIAISPDGTRLYGAAAGSQLVAGLSLDGTTGLVSGLINFLSVSKPYRVALHPGGQWLVAARFGDSQLETFAVDGASGELSFAAAIPVATNPIDLSFDTAGDVLRVASFGARRLVSLRFDAGAGSLTQEQSLLLDGRPAGVVELDAAQSSALVPLFDRAQVARLATSAIGFDPPSSLEVAGAVGTSLAPVHTLVVRAAGGATLVPGPIYAVAQTDGLLHSLDVPTVGAGIAPLAAPVFAGNGPSALDLDATGETLAVASQLSSEVRAFQVTDDTPTSDAKPSPTGFLTRDVANTRDGALVLVVTSLGLESFRREGDLLLPVDSASAGDSPSALALSVDERFVYVANRGSGTLSAFRLDAVGGLSPVVGSPFVLGLASEPRALAVAPDGRTLYVALEALNQIRSFAIEPQTGSLTSGPSAFTTPSPRGLAISPSGNHLISADTGLNRLTVFRIAADSSLTQLQSLPVGTAPRAVAFDATGRSVAAATFFANQVERFAFDPPTGTLSPLDVVFLGAGSGPVDVAIAPRWQDL